MMDRESKYRERTRVLMLATCSGAKRGANSMTTRPRGNSTYSVLSGSSGRQSAGLEAFRTSVILGALAADAAADKKTSIDRVNNLKLRGMNQVLHKSAGSLAESGMRRILVCCVVLFAWLGAGVPMAQAQGYPGGGGGMPGGGRPGMGQSQPGGDIPSTPQTEKPDAAAKKAFKAGMKSLGKARELEEAAAKATNLDKKADAMDKVEAWDNVGYIHLRLGAYNESIDDYNHALALKADLLDAVEGRGEAYMAVDRLEQAQAAYMDLFNHSRPLADQLMASMQKWLESHRAAANGMRAADIESFGKWLQERDGIAKQTASASAPATAPAAAPNPP